MKRARLGVESFAKHGHRLERPSNTVLEASLLEHVGRMSVGHDCLTVPKQVLHPFVDQVRDSMRAMSVVHADLRLYGQCSRRLVSGECIPKPHFPHPLAAGLAWDGRHLNEAVRK
jgi:hypothetical protein